MITKGSGLTGHFLSLEIYLQKERAEVIPRLKEGDHEVATNNRLISLPPALSKVAERIAHEQFVHYLRSCNKLSSPSKRKQETPFYGHPRNIV